MLMQQQRTRQIVNLRVLAHAGRQAEQCQFEVQIPERLEIRKILAS